MQINNTKVKETAYTGLVRAALEYCSTIWDPHHHKYIDQLQKVQRRAARFVCNSYYYKASVTDMLNKLAWESLEASTQGKTCYVLQDSERPHMHPPTIFHSEIKSAKRRASSSVQNCLLIHRSIQEQLLCANSPRMEPPACVYWYPG